MKLQQRYKLLFYLLGVFAMTTSYAELADSKLPEGFVFLNEAIPDIEEDIRYYSDHNFIGSPIDGYGSSRAILSLRAAQALQAVQEELGEFGLGLLVFDAYRPQRAVDHFVRWARDIDDQKMKTEFYPDVDKHKLFEKGYIAAKSSHSRGSTVDLTIISLHGDDYSAHLDMGSPFDFFGPESWPDFPNINTQQRANRMLLFTVMTKHGFQPYPQEWWHFTFINEPFPDSYFDFAIP